MAKFQLNTTRPPKKSNGEPVYKPGHVFEADNMEALFKDKPSLRGKVTRMVEQPKSKEAEMIELSKHNEIVSSLTGKNEALKAELEALKQSGQLEVATPEKDEEEVKAELKAAIKAAGGEVPKGNASIETLQEALEKAKQA